MIVCFDIDGVLCNQVEGDYATAVPDRDMIAMLNRLYDKGHRIVLHTSRFMGRAGSDPAKAREVGEAFTVAQLAGWGVKYHELVMGKPRYHVVIDDRSVFYRADPGAIEAAIEQKSSD